MKKIFKGFIFITFFIILSSRSYSNNTKIPILMYHDITPAAQSDNPWAVTQQAFFDDMVYLKQNNYTTLLPKDVIAIKDGQIPMPLNPIMITFDDGYSSNYYYALPVFEALDMKGTVAVVTSLMRVSEEDGSPEYLTWSQISSMYQSGYIDIGSHTHDLHNSKQAGAFNKNGINGISHIKGESQESYEKRVGEDLEKSIALIKKYTKIAPCYFAYPYGSVDGWFNKCLTNNDIAITTTVKFRIATIKNDLLQLPRLTVTPQASASMVLTKQKQQAVLEGKAISQQFLVNEKMVTIPGYLISGYAYISLADLQTYCEKSPKQFIIKHDSKQNIQLIFEEVENTVLENNDISTLSYLTLTDCTINNAPILIGIDTNYAVAFPINGNYYIRLTDIKKYIEHEKTS